MYSMAGVSKAHVATVSWLMRLLADAANRQGCFLGASDLLVQTETAYYYPDVVVSCEPSDDDRIEHNPCFIVEVLSPTTKRVDRHEKRMAYCAVPTMQDYWVVDLDSKIVEVWSRGAEGWLASHHTASEVLFVRCLDVNAKVSDIVGS
jgi:Uma2 family endonuclease